MVRKHKPKGLHTLEKWKEIVEDWKKSGLNRKTYCKGKKLNASTFYRWEKRLNPSHKPHPEKTLEKWNLIVEDWQKSGLNRSTYCKEKKLHPPSFYRWEKRFNPSRKPHQVEMVEKWTPIVEDWKKSGLSRQAYCIQNELTNSFYQWEKKLNPSVSRKTSHLIALEKWPPIIEDWKKSGLNRYVYCTKKGLTYSCFYKWEKKLNPRSSQSLSDPIKKTEIKSDPPLKDFFVPFPLTSTSSKDSGSLNPKIEIVLSQGHHLYLEGIFDWEKLASWLTPLLRG